MHTLFELTRAFQLLRGALSYADLDKAVRPERLPRSTISNILTGKSVPTRENVVKFLTACGLDKQGQAPWLAAWERARTEYQRQPPGAVRVRDAQPRLLGVHDSILAEGTIGELPVYVPRDFDNQLRSAIRGAAANGGLVLLLGGSSVGKTRALFEAAQSVLPE